MWKELKSTTIVDAHTPARPERWASPPQQKEADITAMAEEGGALRIADSIQVDPPILLPVSIHVHYTRQLNRVVLPLYSLCARMSNFIFRLP